MTTDRTAALGDDPVAALNEAVEIARAGLAPVPIDPAARREWSEALDERLRRLAVKAAPGMEAGKGREWREAMVEALADLPAMVSLTAAKRAIHRPFKFLNEIEEAVRRIAVEVIRERRDTIARLVALRDALLPKPIALPPQDPAQPLSEDEVAAMPPYLIRVGLAAGFVTQEVADAVAARRAGQESE